MVYVRKEAAVMKSDTNILYIIRIGDIKPWGVLVSNI